MGNGKSFIIVGILFAGLAWLLDSVVDWLFFSGGTFWEALIAEVPAHELYIRSITVAVVVVFGILVSAATSKQRQAERKAAQSERSLQELFDAIQYGISVRDRELNVVRVNKWEEQKYASQMPLVGKKCYRVFQQRSSPCPWCPSVKAKETGHPQVAIVPYPSEEDPTGWIELSAFPLLDAEGNVVGTIEHAKDVTERKQMEAALRESEERFRATFEQAAVGIAHVAPDGRFLRINQRYCDIVGYTREEMLERSFQDITHPDDLEAGRSFTSRLLGGEIGSCSYEKRYYHKNGSTVWVTLTGALVREPSGSPSYFIAVAEDITARKEAERKVVENERFLQRVFDSIQDAISVRDRELNVVRTNRWMEKKYASEMPLVGRKCYEVFQKRSSVCPWCPSTRAMETGEPHRSIVPYPSADNPTGWFELSAFPLEDADGTVVGVIEHGKEITERRRAERELHESREKYRSIFEHSPEMIVLMDLEGTLVDANQKAEELSGYERDELVGMHFSQLPFWTEETKPRLAETFARRLRGEQIAPYELDFTRRDGSMMTCRVQGALLADAEGAATGILLILSDVTEQRQAENALRQEKERAQDYLDIVAVILVAIDLEGRVTLINREGCAVLGKTEEGIVGKNWFDLAIPERQRDEVKQGFARLIAGEGSREKQCENSVVTSRGEERIIAWHNTVVKDAAGNVVGTLSSGQDVTDRKRAEDALREREQMIRALVETSRDWIWSIDLKGVHTYCNPAAEAILGYPPEELVGKESFSLMHDDDRATAQAEMSKSIAERRGWRNLVLRWQHKDGGWRYLESNAVQILDVDGELVGFRGVDRDITDRRRAEEALRESEEKFRGLAERSFDMIFITDREGKITYVSPAAERIFHFEPKEMVGRHFSDFLAPSEVPRAVEIFTRRMHGEEVDVVPLEAVRKDGQSVFVELNSWPVMEDDAIVALQGIIRDTTERRQAEERLRRMETQLAHVARLSTLGELVAGIAHEVNQPLYCVVNFAKATMNVLSAEGEPNLAELREWNEEIALAAHRASEIITRLRDFARRRELQHACVRIDEVARESVELVASETRSRGVAVRLDLAAEGTLADVDRVQIQQVLVNLLRNACEALEGVPSGKREIAVCTAVVDQCVEVSVADNGPGLPGGHLKIFDAFVTTKSDGLGMGLAISRTIVEAHGGRLWATPNRRGGTTFRFTVPVAEEGPSDGRRADSLRR